MPSRIALTLIVAATLAGIVLLTSKVALDDTNGTSSQALESKKQQHNRAHPTISSGDHFEKLPQGQKPAPRTRKSATQDQIGHQSSDALAKLNLSTRPSPPEGSVTRAQVAREITGSSRLSPPEMKVLLMYNELAFDLQQHQSCEGLGELAQDRIKTGKTVLEALISSQKDLSPGERIQATQNMTTAAPMAARQLRESLQDGLARCPGDDAFRGALRDLTSMNPVPK